MSEARGAVLACLGWQQCSRFHLYFHKVFLSESTPLSLLSHFLGVHCPVRTFTIVFHLRWSHMGLCNPVNLQRAFNQIRSHLQVPKWTFFFFSRGLLFRFLLLDTSIMKNDFCKKGFIQRIQPGHGPNGRILERRLQRNTAYSISPHDLHNLLLNATQDHLSGAYTPHSELGPPPSGTNQERDPQRSPWTNLKEATPSWTSLSLSDSSGCHCRQKTKQHQGGPLLIHCSILYIKLYLTYFRKFGTGQVSMLDISRSLPSLRCG